MHKYPTAEAEKDGDDGRICGIARNTGRTGRHIDTKCISWDRGSRGYVGGGDRLSRSCKMDNGSWFGWGRRTSTSVERRSILRSKTRPHICFVTCYAAILRYQLHIITTDMISIGGFMALSCYRAPCWSAAGTNMVLGRTHAQMTVGAVRRRRVAVSERRENGRPARRDQK